MIKIFGSLSNDDGNAKENFIAIIPTRLNCLMWLNYAGAEFVGTALNFSLRNKNSPSCVPVLPKTLKLVIAHCRFAEDGKEMC